MADQRPKVLIEEWLPAAAIGVECVRERSTGQQPPDKRLHVWWARRPLTASRAAVLASLLPADFPRDVFERLLGFWGPSESVVRAQARLDLAKAAGEKVPNPHGLRAFRAGLRPGDLATATAAVDGIWGDSVTIIDPMAGGGSIPLESARLGITTLANEYNPVACAVLEATVDYPFRFGKRLAEKARIWGRELRLRFNSRVQPFFPTSGTIPPLTYIYARTVPCPDTGFSTPLVPDWHLKKPKSGLRIVAEPSANRQRGTWSIQVREIGRGAGQLRTPPAATYSGGKGVSLFTGRQISGDYIKSMAQSARMGSELYAMAFKKPRGGAGVQAAGACGPAGP